MTNKKLKRICITTNRYWRRPSLYPMMGLWNGINFALCDFAILLCFIATVFGSAYCLLQASLDTYTEGVYMLRCLALGLPMATFAILAFLSVFLAGKSEIFSTCLKEMIVAGWGTGGRDGIETGAAER